MSIYRWAVLPMIALSLPSHAFAESPSVTAVLSNSEAAVGETVQLQIKVSGSGAKPPSEISIDGLDIRQTGTEQRYEMNNFNVSQSVVYNYTILPTRAGTFKIPPQPVRVSNQMLRTPELTLHVSDSTAGSATARVPRSSGSIDTSKLLFAELIVPKKTAYVGEMIPVEVRLGFDPRARPKLIDGPEISGQGFTAQKLHQAGENVETINGKPYDVVTFKSAVAAARAGTFQIGPVTAKAQVAIPRRAGAARSRSPFDLFSLDDPFADPFFADPFGRLAERREVDLKSEPVEFEVKPLPPNAPPGFTGAVGNFTVSSEAKPTTVQVGDPITVRSTITGRGNFDRVNAPDLQDERGWHKYPPSSSFKQDDDVGISGTKTFEMVISPNENKRAVPPLVFSFFDPAKQKYVAVNTQPIPVIVSGAPATPAPVASIAASQPPGVSPASAAASARIAPKPQDILYQLNDRGPTASFAPLFMRREFWVAQVAPLLALLAFVAWNVRQRRRDSRQARRVATLEHESSELLRRLRRRDLSPAEYFSDAARAVRLKTALAKDVDPNVVDAEMAASAFALDEVSRAQLQRLFERNDELRYSGRPNGAETINGEDRREVLDLIESLRT
ncbi:MAG TPA: BatD family protein [Chthoniobacterales bacterium]|nr:BatD family protein [Chthoniobacterales bacterium]